MQSEQKLTLIITITVACLLWFANCYQDHTWKHNTWKTLNAAKKLKPDDQDERSSANLRCDVCKLLISQLRDMVQQQRTTEELISAAIAVCKLYKIEDDRVCNLVVPQYQEMGLAVVRGTLLSPDEICGSILGDTCAVPYDPFDMWNITISDKPKPPIKPNILPKPGSPVLRILHVTDIHFDPEYKSGADADCGEPLCCRANDQYPAPTPNRAGGRWGDYRNCDTPYNTLENLFQHIADIRSQFDYVIFTGDLNAHNVWNQTRTEQLTSLLNVAKLFRQYLPNTPVYINLGNHEGVPCDSFPPEGLDGQSMTWMYSAMMQAWGYWLPASTYSTIIRGGFYTFSPFPGFRIISLNSNYGSKDNWWLMLNNTDPMGQLQWLAGVLQDAEDKGEKVHIMFHHPPGNLMKSFSWNYYRLVNRYESLITAQFHGHTHKDEHQVFYDPENRTRATSVSYIGGSVTPYSNLNPGYRIYTMDGNYSESSWEILDYQHYIFNLTSVNTGGTVVWDTEYSPLKEYNMKSLFPEDWDSLINRMKTNDTLFQKYYRYYYKSHPTSFCDANCKFNMLCRMKSARPDDPEQCKDLL